MRISLEDNIRRVIADMQPQMLGKVIENRTTSKPAVAIICQKSYLKWFCEGDTRNRWRDGQVCPDVDKELWRLGPDGSEKEDPGKGERAEIKDKRVRERERTEGGGEMEKRERGRKETERESGRERVKPALNGEKG
ncbi:hypothetical protein TNCV_930821 [Trichonephila clavipes]|uniref:Uncharacterized protein n=1 Tax=Trichonephila clavipes TaxID=2585209 RepID=A0A8X7BCJ5_TRICX|nr:hypothetical protein TNCV_930821 [Trichonephila clavipes]